MMTARSGAGSAGNDDQQGAAVCTAVCAEASNAAAPKTPWESCRCSATVVKHHCSCACLCMQGKHVQLVVAQSWVPGQARRRSSGCTQGYVWM